MTNTKPAATTETCQICEAACKMKNGRTSLHGYNRPGHGFIVGQCRGAKQLSWEVSCDVLRTWVGELQQMLTAAQAQMVAFPERTTFAIEVHTFETIMGERRIVYRNRKPVMAIEMVGEGHREFDGAKRRALVNLTNRIDQLTSEITRQGARLADWKAAA